MICLDLATVDELDYVRDKLQITKSSTKKTASLHLRFCTRPADDHVNGYVDDSFYIECFKRIPEDTTCLYFFLMIFQNRRE